MKNIKRLVALATIIGIMQQSIPASAIAEKLESIKAPTAWGAIPTEEQVKYHEEELAAFVHFGMNTFTNREWGDGKENPNLFNPTDLDPMQWVKTLKDAGFKRLIMIGRHHDGFTLWKSQYTDHDVESSTDWQKSQNGEGDVLLEVSKACSYYDMDMGLYLSPWDANNPSYGYGDGTDKESDTNADYNEYYMNQLKEILGNPKYGNKGKFVEVWMDGAKGSGAAAQHYEFDKWFKLIDDLQPGCLIFSPYGSTVRWIGNESGKAGDPCWSKLNKDRQRNRYDSGGGDENGYLNTGDPDGDIWSIGECDVSLTSGWFWHQGNSPKSMEDLTDIYFKSVGRGQPLLLNVAPDNRGKFTDNDVARLKEFSSAIKKTFDEDLTDKNGVSSEVTSYRGNSSLYSSDKAIDNNNDTYWTMNDGETTGTLTINLGEDKIFDVVSIEEYIKLGQRVSKFKVEVHSNGEWRNFGTGSTIGAKRLVRSYPVTADKIRITIEESQAVPLISEVGVYKADSDFEMEPIAPIGTEFIDNVDFENKNTWTQESIGINNTGMWSSAKDTNASFKFTGTKAWIVGTVDPNHGIMEVWVDGKLVKEVDTYNPKRSVSQILYGTDDLKYGEHTVKVVVSGRKNQAAKGNAIGIDGAYYLNNNEAGMFEIDKSSYTVKEGETQSITINRVAGSKGDATVHISTPPDSAVHGRHYEDLNKTVTFKDGQESVTVEVKTIDNNENAGDVRFFIGLDSPSGESILGFNKKAEIIIKDNDSDNGQYSEEDPYVFPSKINESKVLEAENFILDPIEGEKHVRVNENSSLSGGKGISWFEEGNKIKLPFNAPKAGTYTFTMSYQSGRSNDNKNTINWSGTNVKEGNKAVDGTGNQNPMPVKTVSFNVEITKPGKGELIFTADSHSSPNIDKFEVVATNLIEPNHSESNPIVVSNEEVTVEAEDLSLGGTGAQIENKQGASNGKVVGWLGKTSKGTSWLDMWVNFEEEGEYEIDITYLAGAQDKLCYENNDDSIKGDFTCKVTDPNFDKATIKVNAKSGVDKIKFFNNDASTANIDKITIRKVESVVEVDKSLLNSAIEQAKTKIESEYTQESWDKFEVALENAENVAGNINATQDEVDNALDELTESIKELAKVQHSEDIDKTAISNKIEEIHKLDSSKYTSESWDALLKVIDEAEEVINNEDVTEEEVNLIIDKLNSYQGALVEKEEKAEVPEEPLNLESPDNDKGDENIDDSKDENDKKNEPIKTGDVSSLGSIIASLMGAGYMIVSSRKRKTNK